MNGHRVIALFRRVVQEIRRDRPSIGLLFVAPVLLTGLLAFILREAEAPRIEAVIVSPAGPDGERVAAALGAALEDGGSTVERAPDEGTARGAVETGDATIAIVLPENLGSGAEPVVTVITNGLDPSGESTQLAEVQRSMLTAARAVTGASLPTVEHTTVYGTPSDDPITRYAPAIVGFFAYFFVYILTGLASCGNAPAGPWSG